MMKLIGFSRGSAKNGDGCENILLRRIAEGARVGGASFKMVHFEDLNIGESGSCEPNAGRVENDDMHMIYHEMIKSSAMVFDLPFYCEQLGGKTKLFMERLEEIMSSPMGLILKGKKIIIAYARTANMRHALILNLDSCSGRFKKMGFEATGTAVTSESMELEDGLRPSYLTEYAIELGSNLTKMN